MVLFKFIARERVHSTPNSSDGCIVDEINKE